MSEQVDLLDDDVFKSRERFHGGLPTMRIQWKGTSICADMRCVCGSSWHVDAEFAYALRCPDCHRIFWANPMINLVEMTPAEAEQWLTKRYALVGDALVDAWTRKS